MPDDTCIANDCDRPVDIKRWTLCRRHYLLAWRAGQLDGLKRHEDRERHVVRDGVCLTNPADRVSGRSDRAPVCLVGQKLSVRLHRTGVPTAIVDAMFDACGWRCQICTTTFTLENPACVDHDHACCPGTRSCGKCVRGLLCRRCNTGIGMFLDDVALIRAAARYVGRWQKNLPST